MKMSFSTLACPDWAMSRIMKIAVDAGYDGIELRIVEGEASLWKLAAFSGTQAPATKRALADYGLSISCVDTSCCFHSPDEKERDRWIGEGLRMSDLAANSVPLQSAFSVTRSSPAPVRNQREVGSQNRFVNSPRSPPRRASRSGLKRTATSAVRRRPQQSCRNPVRSTSESCGTP